MTETTFKTYPNIAQSFGICGISIVGFLLFIPVYFLLKNVIGAEGARFFYYIFASGIPLLLAHFIRKRKTVSSTFNFAINKKIILFLVIATLALLFGIISPISSLIPMSESAKRRLLEFGSQTGPLAFVMMVIAAPVFEELIFRGIILDGLLKKYTPLKSITVSSLMFGLVHLNPWQFVTGFTNGVFSGSVYFKTRSVFACIIIHIAANLAGFSMKYLVDDLQSLDQSMLDFYGGWINLTLVVVGSALVILACLWFLKREFLRESSTAQA